MRTGMIAGLRMWRDRTGGRDDVMRSVTHDGWSIEVRRAPLGVVAFVFEGRPNVLADAYCQCCIGASSTSCPSPWWGGGCQRLPYQQENRRLPLPRRREPKPQPQSEPICLQRTGTNASARSNPDT